MISFSWYISSNTGNVPALVPSNSHECRMHTRMLFDPVFYYLLFLFPLVTAVIYCNQMDHLGHCACTYVGSSEMGASCLALFWPVKLACPVSLWISYYMCCTTLKWSDTYIFLQCFMHLLYVCAAALIGTLIPLYFLTLPGGLNPHFQSSALLDWIHCQVDFCVFFNRP